jgi:hypothetical protein
VGSADPSPGSSNQLIITGVGGEYEWPDGIYFDLRTTIVILPQANQGSSDGKVARDT